MTKTRRAFFGVTGGLLLFSYGLYSWVTGYPISGLSFVPILFTIGGLIGIAENVWELFKQKKLKNN